MEGQISEAGSISTTDVGAAPVAEGAGTGGAPVAEAPVAEAAAPAAPEAPPVASFPSADEWGWDEWDGTPDALPEEIRGWHSKFDERFNSTKAELEQEWEQKLTKSQQNAKAWEDMFDALSSGGEDPRVAQATQELNGLREEFAQYRMEVEEREARYAEYIERETERYYNMVAERNPEIIEKMNATPGADDVIMSLMGEGDQDGLEFEAALQVWDRGEEAVAFAQAAVADGVANKYIKDLVDLKFPKQAPPKPKTQPASVDLVTGSEPVRRSAPIPTKDTTPGNLEDARRLAAERAWARMTGKR